MHCLGGTLDKGGGSSTVRAVHLSGCLGRPSLFECPFFFDTFCGNITKCTDAGCPYPLASACQGKSPHPSSSSHGVGDDGQRP